MAQVFKGAGTKVAKLPGIQPLLDAAASAILARAAANAAAHMDTGSYASSLRVHTVPGKKGVMDRLVVAEDPAAVHIEYGHLSGGKTPQWVPGQFILTKSIGG